jgi:hypothetical protein
MTYDSGRSRVVVFGGYLNLANGALASDTWEWDGSTWTNPQPAHSPPARREHALAYDSTRAVTVLFGGYGNGGTLNDTWEWNGVDWQQVSPFSSPSPRSGHVMAFDPTGNRVVLLGGADSLGNTYNDAWAWDGSTWTALSGSLPLAARTGAGFAFDVARMRLVLWGGKAFSSTPTTQLNDTWELTESSAAQVSTALTPPALPIDMTPQPESYDVSRQRIVLYGGTGAESTWEYYDQ